MATKQGSGKSAVERKGATTYARSLNALVDKLFEVAYQQGLSWERMAERSGLARATIEKLGMRVTQYPQYRTVQLLAHALGGRLDYVKGQVGTTAGRMAVIRIHWKPDNFRLRKRKKAA